MILVFPNSTFGLFCKEIDWSSYLILLSLSITERSLYKNGKSGEALLCPYIGSVVIAGLFPEAQPVAVHELQPAQPLGTLPKVGSLEVIPAGMAPTTPRRG